MRTTLISFLVTLMVLFACEDNTEQIEFDYTYGSIQATGKKLTQIKYDTTVTSYLEYDNRNNLIKISNKYTDTLVVVSVYTYNEEDRLVNAQFTDWQENYIYEGEKLVEKRTIYSKPYGNWEVPTLKFLYNEYDQIIRAESFVGDTLTSYSDYEYDQKGNVIHVLEYAASAPGSLVLTETKMEYDNQPVPIKLPNINPVERAQVNNITYSYHYNILLSSLPPEHRSVYEYDATGYPTKETRTLLVQGNEVGEQEIIYVYE